MCDVLLQGGEGGWRHMPSSGPYITERPDGLSQLQIHNLLSESWAIYSAEADWVKMMRLYSTFTVLSTTENAFFIISQMEPVYHTHESNFSCFLLTCAAGDAEIEPPTSCECSTLVCLLKLQRPRQKLGHHNLCCFILICVHVVLCTVKSPSVTEPLCHLSHTLYFGKWIKKSCSETKWSFKKRKWKEWKTSS